jgi:hypothetical protein
MNWRRFIPIPEPETIRHLAQATTPGVTWGKFGHSRQSPLWVIQVGVDISSACPVRGYLGLRPQIARGPKSASRSCTATNSMVLLPVKNTLD